MPRFLLLQILLGLGHQLDHALVGFARVGAEGENAMRQQHHPNAAGGRLSRKFAGAVRGEIETGHDVRDDDDPPAVDFANALLALRRIGHREHGVGMRVIDVRVRQDGVEDGFNRRRGRAGAQHVRVELVHHLRIGQAGEPRQPAHMPERDRRKAGRLDRLEVPAAALHVEHVLVLAKEIALAQLDGSIAAAVQDQRFVAAQQARGVDARTERPAESRRLGVAPEAFHPAIILLPPCCKSS